MMVKIVSKNFLDIMEIALYTTEPICNDEIDGIIYRLVD